MLQRSRLQIMGLCASLTALLLLLVQPPTVATQSPSNDRPGRAKRIISLAPSITETLFALGAGDHVVGVTSFCDYPPEVKRLPSVGTFMNPNTESMLALKPDLIIAVPERADRERLARLEALSLNILLLRASTLTDIFQSLRSLADIVEKKSQGEKLIETMQRQIQGITSKLKNSQHPRVLVVVGSRPLIAVGSGTYISELISLAGGENIAASTAQAWPALSPEFIVAQAPEVIIEAGMGSEQQSRNRWWSDYTSIPAVRNSRVHRVPSDKLLRPGPRLGEALHELARLIHPECFSAPPLTGGRCAGA